MDHYTILDRTAAAPEAAVVGLPGVSAGMAAANALLPEVAGIEPRWPEEAPGETLAEMASADLDAALQLLADRAQYITGASGAAIALRRGEHPEMMCRASAGSNAPELGALLSMDRGLSGECVRTRRPLRCDDAEEDPRVNREVCRELGIASVMMMPIVGEAKVLGVFELFSGQARAFGERELSTLVRLTRMVETAVMQASAAQTLASMLLMNSLPDAVAEAPGPAGEEAELAVGPGSPEGNRGADPKQTPYWSATLRAQSSATPSEGFASSIVGPCELRNLQKCQACGFPVSQGRSLCVECEEQKWRGERVPQTATAGAAGPRGAAVQVPTAKIQNASIQNAAADRVMENRLEPAKAAPLLGSGVSAEIASLAGESRSVAEILPAAIGGESCPDTQANLAAFEGAPFLSSALETESWLSKNKYVAGTLLVVSAILGYAAWFHAAWFR